jgi:hypothetical protein
VKRTDTLGIVQPEAQVELEALSSLIDELGAVARRYDVMISITVSPNSRDDGEQEDDRDPNDAQ